MAVRRPIRLPKQWPAHVKPGILHAISLASVVLSYARGRATGRRRSRAQLEQATAEIALLREELGIKDGRWERARSRRRPHYIPTQRMRILQLRAVLVEEGQQVRGESLALLAGFYDIENRPKLVRQSALGDPGFHPAVETGTP